MNSPEATTHNSAETLPHGALSVVREWSDALVIAFVLAMFIKLFLVELYKIPTGSMTPTLIGGDVAWLDYDNDGRKDLLLFSEGWSTRRWPPPLLFLNDGQRYIAHGRVDYTDPPFGAIHEQYDRILVNKFAYWFRPPSRGDIVVFKVPHVIWDPSKPIYIKRCVGEPGDRLTFDAQGGLVANGERVTKPEFFNYWRYLTTLDETPDVMRQPEITYTQPNTNQVSIRQIDVPRDKIYVFGDNTNSSLDSRYWGGVPIRNLKGRAFFRYWPLSQMKFLRGI